LEKLPPIPLPETLWGDRWRFAALPASDVETAFTDRPIPILYLPPALLPSHLQLPPTLLVPGVVIDGGRQSMPLARWLQAAQPVSLIYVSAELGGLILEAGQADRWILTTFADLEVRAAGETYVQRKRASHGLHFLLVQPDDSGMTLSGFWLLRSEYNG